MRDIDKKIEDTMFTRIDWFASKDDFVLRWSLSLLVEISIYRIRLRTNQRGRTVLIIMFYIFWLAKNFGYCRHPHNYFLDISSFRKRIKYIVLLHARIQAMFQWTHNHRMLRVDKAVANKKSRMKFGKQSLSPHRRMSHHHVTRHDGFTL